MTLAPDAAPTRRSATATRLILGVGWYPVLIGVACFLEVWSSARVEPSAALRALPVAVAIAGATTVMLSLALGRYRAALAATIVVPVQPNQAWFGPRAQDGAFLLIPAGALR